MRKQTAFND